MATLKRKILEFIGELALKILKKKLADEEAKKSKGENK